jgi:protein-S-isoprenylcysteine O-methyltransferase Ste14
MESPTVLLFAAVYALGDHALQAAPLAMFGMWMLHYVHRTFVFPFRVKTPGKQMPVVIVAMAFAFNVLNAYVIARWISHLRDYPGSWLGDPRFIAGAAIFGIGMVVNHYADTTLISLRGAGETGYTIPRGGMFEHVASPNYLGEILEWTGYAIATWSLAGGAFAVFTAANVGPRAFSNLRWYRETFPDYPEDRKALIPLLW